MRKRFWVAMLAICVIASSYGLTHVFAISQSIVISQVQLGTTTSASNEIVELYNNSASDIEITNWCLYYASAASTSSGSKLGCFTAESELVHLYLPAHSYALAISTIMASNNPALLSDLKFSATLSGTAGHVRLIDTTQSEIDKIGWGTTASSPETIGTTTAPNGKVLQRKILSATQLQDTDNNAADFELVAPRSMYVSGAIYETQDICVNIDGIQQDIPEGYSLETGAICTPPPTDVCGNIDGIQTSLPAQYLYDTSGLCQYDLCPNISELQLTMPTALELDSVGDCVEHDMCLNLGGIQAVVPEGYYETTSELCMISFATIVINELLANAVGDDMGGEYIELYNPTSNRIDLVNYRLHIGTSTIKIYTFPNGSAIEPFGYYVVSDDDVHFTLINTVGSVALMTSDGQLVNGPVSYLDPEEGVSWSLIESVWQYSDQPSRGNSNLPSATVFDDIEEIVTGLKPCAPNQYRNLETNRCRLLVTTGSTLSACKVGQYRNEETNRCRSIASDAVQQTACNANQERNPETNRCRLIAGSDTALAPCKDNQERNPDTNRCRNVVSQVPSAAFAVEPVADTAEAFMGWWALGGLGLLALIYAGWEWRVEIVRASQKLATFFHHTK